MTERINLWQLLLALNTLTVFTWCYARGGGPGPGSALPNKRWRRVVGSLLYNAGCLILAVWLGRASWWMLLAFPAYYGWLTMGYGADDLGSKLWRRALYGLVGGAVSGCWLLPLGGLAWTLWLFQIGLAMSASLFYGVWNPQSRVGEEAAIAFLSVVVAPLALIG